MPLHSGLTDADGIHEPKGISTAEEIQVYVADGADSGDWKYFPTGWSYTQHSGAAQTFDTSEDKLLINGSGAGTIVTYLPPAIRGSSTLWNTSSNKIIPIALGDAYLVRLDLPITARTSAVELTIELDISGGASASNVIATKYLGINKTPSFTTTVEFLVPVVSSTVVSNGVQFFLTVDAGSIEITNPAITVSRIHAGDF